MSDPAPIPADAPAAATTAETLQFENARAVQLLYGNEPALLKSVEETLGVRVTTREGWLKLEGDPAGVAKARRVFEQLEAARQAGISLHPALGGGRQVRAGPFLADER